ncbi:MAG: hypothetical protein WCA20_16905 [Candidatus Sulfotelmatobacter sp.]
MGSMGSMGSVGQASKRFSLVLIKPSHYDDDGYVIQWFRSAIPSNTLAILNLKRDPDAIHSDLALTPVEEDRCEEMELAAMGPGQSRGW